MWHFGITFGIEVAESGAPHRTSDSSSYESDFVFSAAAFAARLPGGEDDFMETLYVSRLTHFPRTDLLSSVKLERVFIR